MKKIVILSIFWCSCILVWVVFWLSERKNAKPVKLILNTESLADKNDLQDSSVSPVVFRETEKSDDSTDKCINVNLSDIDRLCLLPGIGPGLAERIVLFRQQNGAFKNVDDLLKVKGIGAAKLGQFQNRICF